MYNLPISTGVFRKLQTPPEIMRKLPISGEIIINHFFIKIYKKKMNFFCRIFSII